MKTMESLLINAVLRKGSFFFLSLIGWGRVLSLFSFAAVLNVMLCEPGQHTRQD